MDNRPIGIFDSGVGGLTVANAINKLLPNETICYVGDTARVPYGNKSKMSILKFSKQITNWLIKQNCKVIIIACNTASSLPLDRPDLARHFFETRFQPFLATASGQPEGLFTGYFEMELRGSWLRKKSYTTPIYGRPPELVEADLGAFRDDYKGKRLLGKIIAGNIADGTNDNISLILSLNISFLIKAIMENLVRYVINPQYRINAQLLMLFYFSLLKSLQ